MKTDRFDEEFRRKLGELPEESSPDEVNRIAGYVSQHLPPAPGTGWGGLAGYVVGGLVLLSSLLYNVVQYQKTAVLQTTVATLRTAPLSLVQQTAPAAPSAVRTDTIYVIRYRNRPESGPAPLIQPTLFADVKTSQRPSASARNQQDIPFVGNPNPLTQQADDTEPTTNELAESKARRLPNSVPENRSGMTLESARKEGIANAEPATDSTGATAAKPVVKTAVPSLSKSVRPEISAEPNVANPLRNTVSDKTGKSSRRHVARAKTGQKTNVNNPANGRLARERMGSTTGVNQTLTNNTTPNSTVSRLTEVVQALTDAEKERTERAEVAVSLLKNRALTSINLSATILRKPDYQPVAVTKAMPVRKSFRLNLPTISIPGARYYGGLDFMGGHEHLSGSLLGEMRINRHWSVQTGIRATTLTSEDYHSDKEYKEEEGRDFRALYAPNVAPGSEIQDIQQNYSLVQIPLTVAYHYPLGRAWALRLGVGTSLDVLAHTRVAFDFERSGREFERGLYASKVPVSLFNNATVSAGVEWQWKRLLFRASPYISPQFRRVSYKDDAFYWGGQAQVLWQFK